MGRLFHRRCYAANVSCQAEQSAEQGYSDLVIPPARSAKNEYDPAYNERVSLKKDQYGRTVVAIQTKSENTIGAGWQTRETTHEHSQLVGPLGRPRRIGGPFCHYETYTCGVPGQKYSSQFAANASAEDHPSLYYRAAADSDVKNTKNVEITLAAEVTNCTITVNGKTYRVVDGKLQTEGSPAKPSIQPRKDEPVVLSPVGPAGKIEPHAVPRPDGNGSGTAADLQPIPGTEPSPTPAPTSKKTNTTVPPVRNRALQPEANNEQPADTTPGTEKNEQPAMNTELNQQREKTASLERQLAAATTKLATAEGETKKLETKLATVQNNAAVHEKDAIETARSEERKSADKRVQDVKTAADTAVETARADAAKGQKELRDKLTGIEQRNTGLAAQLKEKDSKIAGMEEQITDLGKKRKEDGLQSAGTIQDLQNKLRDLTAELQQARKLGKEGDAAAKERETGLQTQITELNTKLEQESARNAAERKKLQDHVKCLGTIVESQKKSLDENQLKITGQENEITKLQNQRDNDSQKSTEERDRLQNRLDEQKKELEKVQKQADADKASAQEREAKLQAENANLKKQLNNKPKNKEAEPAKSPAGDNPVKSTDAKQEKPAPRSEPASQTAPVNKPSPAARAADTSTRTAKPDQKEAQKQEELEKRIAERRKDLNRLTEERLAKLNDPSYKSSLTQRTRNEERTVEALAALDRFQQGQGRWLSRQPNESHEEFERRREALVEKGVNVLSQHFAFGLGTSIIDGPLSWVSSKDKQTRYAGFVRDIGNLWGQIYEQQAQITRDELALQDLMRNRKQ